MSTAADSKQERINLRLRDSAKRTLERAASFEGKTVSHFILSSALAHAEKTIHEHEILLLNEHDADAFFKALDKPVRFNKKLAALLAEHERRVTSE